MRTPIIYFLLNSRQLFLGSNSELRLCGIAEHLLGDEVCWVGISDALHRNVILKSHDNFREREM